MRNIGDPPLRQLASATTGSNDHAANANALYRVNWYSLSPATDAAAQGHS